MTGRTYFGIRAAAMSRLAVLETRVRFLRALTATLRVDALLHQIALAKVSARATRTSQDHVRWMKLEAEEREAASHRAETIAALGVAAISRDELVRAIDEPGLADGLASAEAVDAYQLAAWHLSLAEAEASRAQEDSALVGSSAEFDQALTRVIDAERAIVRAERAEAEAVRARRRAALELVQARRDCWALSHPIGGSSSNGSGPGVRQAGAPSSSGGANAEGRVTSAGSRIPGSGSRKDDCAALGGAGGHLACGTTSPVPGPDVLRFAGGL